MKRKRSTTEFDIEESLRPSKRPRLEGPKHQSNSPQFYSSLFNLTWADLQPNSPQSYDDLLSIVQPKSPQSYTELLSTVQTDNQPNSAQSYTELLGIVQTDNQPNSPQSYAELLSNVQTNHQSNSPLSYTGLLSIIQTDHQPTCNTPPPDTGLLSLTQTDHQPNPAQSYTNLPGLTQTAFSCNKNNEDRLSCEKPPSPQQGVKELQQSANSNQAGDVEECPAHAPHRLHLLAQTPYFSTSTSPFDLGATQSPVNGEGLSPSGSAAAADLSYSEPEQNILNSVKTGSSIFRKERLFPETVCRSVAESDSLSTQASRKRKLSCTSDVPGEPSPKKRKEQSRTSDVPGEPSPKKRKDLSRTSDLTGEPTLKERKEQLKVKILEEKQKTPTSLNAQSYGTPSGSQSSSYSLTANWRKQLNDWNARNRDIDSKDAHKLKYPSHLHEWLERVKFNHTKTWTMFRYVEPRWTALQIALTRKFKYSSRA